MAITFPQSVFQTVAPDSTATAAPDSVATVTPVWTMGQLFVDGDLWLVMVNGAFHILIILFSAWLIIRIVDKSTRQWMNRFEDLPQIHPRRQRAFTVSTLLTSSTRYVVWPLALIMVMSEIGINIGALLATAGIAGLAIGFGAQTLVKDVISGIFLLFDDTVHVGDRIVIGAEGGVVEHIGVRLLKVRKFNGELMMVPAGELRIFGNGSIDFARVIVQVGLSYEQDLDAILPVMEQVALAWADEHRDILKEENPIVQGITAFGASSVDARIIIQVVPGEQFEAERELRKRLKREFDRLGIEIPFPRQTMYLRRETELPPRTPASTEPTHEKAAE